MTPPKVRESAFVFRGLRVFCTRIFFLLPFALALGVTRASASGDPRLEWRTLESLHFRVHYYSGEEALAERIVRLAEQIHGELVPAFAGPPPHQTDVVITDGTDSANGSATAFPYDLIRLNAVAPDELSPLGDVDDWYRALFTHEYTHILHMTRIEGFPALWNRVVGRTLVPNQWAPRWTLEGLAVLEETQHTSRGRLRSSLWDAYFRADRLSETPATLDRVSGTPRVWPQGTLWYLYGSFFYQWLHRSFGQQAIMTLLASHGSEPIPYGLERSFRRATGLPLSELWHHFLDEEDARVRALQAAHEAAGPRDGQALTSHGFVATHPRWFPSVGNEPERIVYFRSDGHSTPGLVGLPMANGQSVGNSSLIMRTAGDSHAAMSPGGDLFFDAPQVSNQLYLFGDISRISSHTRDLWGDTEAQTRLTTGARSDGLDVSPDGSRIVYVTRHRGQSALVEAGLGRDALEDPRILVGGEHFDQFYGPRFSGDGRFIAYGAWLSTPSREALGEARGAAARDLVLYDRVRGTSELVTHDTALDGGVCFSPQSDWLYFHSDLLDGRFEIHAIELATRRRFRVTRTAFAAVQPAISPRGDFLAFSSYGANGWDLRVMPIDPKNFEPVGTDIGRVRDATHAEPPEVQTTYSDYVPVSSLRPRSYALQYGTGMFGTAIVGSTTGSDASSNHSFTLSARFETERPEPQFDAVYSYGRLRADLSLRAYRSLTARGGGANRALYVLPWVQESVGLETSAGLALPSTFSSHSFRLAAGFVRVAGEAARGTSFDPFNRPLTPFRGQLATLRASWAYDRTQHFLHSIGAERGTSMALNGSLASDVVGSSVMGASLSGQAAAYVPFGDLAAPLRHHTLALHLGAGTSDGAYPGPGAYSLGGFTATPLVTTLQNLIVQGGVALRGYEPFAVSGRHFALVNAEYRFPIVNIDRGIGAYPIFIRRLTGAIFNDTGSAFSAFSSASLRSGSGAELWADTTGGYFIDLLFRLGVARGWNEGGAWHAYAVASTVY